MQRIQVVRVADGDTVIDEDGVKYRLYGIDAPESSQDYGTRAAASLRYLLSQHKNQVYIQNHGREKYGRTLATLYIVDNPTEDWQNLNYVMVLHGHAWVYRFQKEEHRRHAPVVPSFAEYEEAERLARSLKRGLWANPEAVRPSLYRQRKRLELVRRRKQKPNKIQS